ncbi:MAG: helix-turn-helix domain-containing protein [Acidobacteriaceae bacterium]|nr:helix-turn-helix domain-containing protein [Acidobacteriaceae bacterium]
MQANINPSTPIVDLPEIIAGTLAPVDSKALKDVLNVAEVAEILRCSRNHVSNVLNGKVPTVPVLPHFTIGRRKLVRREWLIEWLQAYRRRC